MYEIGLEIWIYLLCIYCFFKYWYAIILEPRKNMMCFNVWDCASTMRSDVGCKNKFFFCKSLSLDVV